MCDLDWFSEIQSHMHYYPSCISEPSAGIVGIKSVNCVATLTEDQQKQLRTVLISSRQEWCKSVNASYLLVGEEI